MNPQESSNQGASKVYFVQTESERSPAVRAAIRNAINELLGLCQGLTADRVLNDLEVKYLRVWIERHSLLLTEWPIRDIYTRLNRCLEDGVISEQERSELTRLIESAAGIDGSGEQRPTSLPLDNPPPEVIFQGNTFCLTGTFKHGTRKACETEVTKRGGICHGQPTWRTDFLVIGSEVTGSWAHTSFGRKIEKAVNFRTTGSSIKIVSEDHWRIYLR